MRVLDFFPLDKWVISISNFFENNLYDILDYIAEYLHRESKLTQMRDDHSR